MQTDPVTGLTATQLAVIKMVIGDRVPSTTREICARLGFKSTNAASTVLRVLEHLGWIDVGNGSGHRGASRHVALHTPLPRALIMPVQFCPGCRMEVMPIAHMSGPGVFECPTCHGRWEIRRVATQEAPLALSAAVIDDFLGPPVPATVERVEWVVVSQKALPLRSQLRVKKMYFKARAELLGSVRTANIYCQGLPEWLLDRVAPGVKFRARVHLDRRGRVLRIDNVEESHDKS